VKLQKVVAGSTLLRLDGQSPGYPVNFGTSFLLALAYTDHGPKAKVFLTYSDTEDRDDANFVKATERFSTKKWRTVAFTQDQIDRQTTTVTDVRG
jgi:acyl-homoserine-lactone acylase